MIQVYLGVRETVPTLREAWAEYSRLKKIKSDTKRGYTQSLNLYLPDWLDLPLTNITKHMIIERHQSVFQRNRRRDGVTGNAAANRLMRTLRAIYNFSINYFETPSGEPLVTVNPVLKLNSLRLWHDVPRRRRYIKRHEIFPWYQAVVDQVNHPCKSDPSHRHRLPVLRDYLLLLWLTGCRHSEAAHLKWEDVDLIGGFITFRGTKNKLDHTLPLSDYLWDMLKRRRQDGPESPYVLPGRNRMKPLSACMKQHERIKWITGIEFSPHDLRRTFASMAINCGVEGYLLKRLLNHATSNDVTAGYIVLEPEDLRPLMQSITDAFLKLATTPPTTDEAGRVITAPIEKPKLVVIGGGQAKRKERYLRFIDSLQNPEGPAYVSN